MVESEQEDDRRGFNQWGRAVEDPDLVARTDGVSPPFFFTELARDLKAGWMNGSPLGKGVMILALVTCVLFLLGCLVFLYTWNSVVNPPSGFRDPQSGLALILPIMFGLFFVLPCFLFTLLLSLIDLLTSHRTVGARSGVALTMTILWGGPLVMGIITFFLAVLIEA